MKQILKTYIEITDKVNELLGKSTAWLTTILMLLVCMDVIRRYAFNTTTVAIIELERHLFALIFLCSLGYSLKYDRHVRVDVLYNHFSEKGRAWINLAGGILFLIPFCLVVIYNSYRFSAYAYQLHESSPDPGGLPYRFLIKGAIMAGFIFLLWQAIAMSCSALLVITGRRDTVFSKLPLREGGQNA